MLQLTVRGLIAHKLRFLLTGIAVVLGVAFVSGTLVFTDTVKKTFNELFASVYDGTDAFVRNHNELDAGFVPPPPQRARAGLGAAPARTDPPVGRGAGARGRRRRRR